jgi:cysteine desulfurase family protein (TIGR01976 family)
MTSPVASPIRSPDDIRADFPALQRVHHGQPVGYFDGPGGTQVPTQVIDAIGDYLRHHNANTHWHYPTSQETDALLTAAREAVADFLHCLPAEVAFGQNMTSLTFHLSRGLAREWRSGDVVIVTELDHHGNVGPWEAVAQEHRLELRRVPFRLESGTLDVERVIDAIDDRTRLVAIGWASNALGSITDVGTVCLTAAERGVASFVDAVHSAPHLLPDVRAIGCDYLACSAYKFYGPHLGILFGRAPLLQTVAVPKLRPAPNEIPERIETGTQNHEAIVGARAAIDFLASIAPGPDRRAALIASYAVLHDRGRALLERLWGGLATIPRVRLFGPPPTAPRTPTVAFVVEGMASSRVAEALAGHGLFASHGDFYAATVIERYDLGDEGLVRAGCACYSIESEVDRLVEAVGVIAG